MDAHDTITTSQINIGSSTLTANTKLASKIQLDAKKKTRPNNLKIEGSVGLNHHIMPNSASKYNSNNNHGASTNGVS